MWNKDDRAIRLHNYFLLLVISSGLNSVPIVKTVSRRGKQARIEIITGLISVTFVHGTISVFGLSAVILQLAQLLLIIERLGAAYLLYLGIKKYTEHLRVRRK